MSKQPRALETAAVLEQQVEAEAGWSTARVLEAAAILRSQHELIGELVGALQELHFCAPTATSCADLHHSPAERHGLGDECKPAAAYLAALAGARAVLSKAKEQA